MTPCGVGHHDVAVRVGCVQAARRHAAESEQDQGGNHHGAALKVDSLQLRARMVWQPGADKSANNVARSNDR